MPTIARVVLVPALLAVAAFAQDVARLSVGDARWAGYVALRTRLGLPAKDGSSAPPVTPANARTAMRAVSAGLHTPAGAHADVTTGRAGMDNALRRAAIDRAFRSAVAADPAAVPALLALAATSPDEDHVVAALSSAGADPLAACRPEQVQELLRVMCEEGTEAVQRLAFAGLLDCLERGPLSPVLEERFARVAKADLPAVAELQTDPQYAMTRRPLDALPRQAFGVPITAAARQVALASLGGDGDLVRKLAKCGADPRFLLQCHALAAQRCDAATAQLLFEWYSPHVATWDQQKQPGFNSWQLGILDLLVAVYPRLKLQQQGWYDCLREPALAIGARNALRRHWQRLSGRGGFAALDGFTALDVADGLRAYAGLCAAAPWGLAACVEAAPGTTAARVRFLRFVVRNAPLGVGDAEARVLSILATEPDIELAASSAHRAMRLGAAGDTAVRAFLATVAGAEAVPARRLAALELAVELAARPDWNLPAGLAPARGAEEQALLDLIAVAHGGDVATRDDAWARVDGSLADLNGSVLRGVLLASRARAVWPEPFSRFVAEQTTDLDPLTRRAAYEALATRDPRTEPFAALAGEVDYDAERASWW